MTGTEFYKLRNDEWKFDKIPEIMDGKNIADFIDPDIERLLDQLEEEEMEQMELLQRAMEEEDDVDLTEEDRALLKEVQESKAVLIQNSRLKQKMNSAPIPRKHNAAKTTVKDFEKHLNDMGMDPTKAVERAKSKSRGRSSARPDHEVSVGGKRRRDQVDFSPGEGLRDVSVSYTHSSPLPSDPPTAKEVRQNHGATLTEDPKPRWAHGRGRSTRLHQEEQTSPLWQDWKWNQRSPLIPSRPHFSQQILCLTLALSDSDLGLKAI